MAPNEKRPRRLLERLDTDPACFLLLHLPQEAKPSYPVYIKQQQASKALPCHQHAATLEVTGRNRLHSLLGPIATHQRPRPGVPLPGAK